MKLSTPGIKCHWYLELFSPSFYQPKQYIFVFESGCFRENASPRRKDSQPGTETLRGWNNILVEQPKPSTSIQIEPELPWFNKFQVLPFTVDIENLQMIVVLQWQSNILQCLDIQRMWFWRTDVRSLQEDCKLVKRAITRDREHTGYIKNILTCSAFWVVQPQWP